MRLHHLLPSQRRILAAIVVELLPSYPELTDEVRSRVAAEATRFVCVQVENIPTFLRVPYLGAILAFNWLALLRYARPFLRLSADRRRVYLAAWTNSPIGPFRDFVRLIRGCAVLSYFDHSEVRRAVEVERSLRVDSERTASEPVRVAAE